jgi:hypothetical protein
MIERDFGDTPEGRQAVLDQEPIGRMGRPEEIAAAVLWLCSEEASFAVGHAMVIDGGQTACSQTIKRQTLPRPQITLVTDCGQRGGRSAGMDEPFRSISGLGRGGGRRIRARRG